MEFLRVIKSGKAKEILGKEDFKKCVLLNKTIKREIENNTK